MSPRKQERQENGPVGIKVQHLTSIANLASIRRHGLLAKARLQAQGIEPADIADASIQEGRHSAPVAWDGGMASVHAFAPLFFRHSPPMLGRIIRDRFAGNVARQGELCYLVTSVKFVRDAGVRCMFTDGHALSPRTRRFTDLVALEQLDWPTIVAKPWDIDKSDEEARRKRQAEFWVHGCLPWDAFRTVIVRDDTSRVRVQQLLGDDAALPRVRIMAEWFYKSFDLRPTDPPTREAG